MASTPDHSRHLIRQVAVPAADTFDRETGGLTAAAPTAIVELEHGARFDLRAEPVAKQLGEDMVRMLAYNGSIPGPTLQVPEGAEVVVHFTNLTEVETTVHWHGLRLEHRFDGVAEGEHGGMQPPVPTGGSYTYRLRFPDPGLFWYHPHLREDYTQEHGLYGNILVVPAEPQYWPPVNREITVAVDDILIEHGQIAPFSRSGPTDIVMGRFGNVMLVNGETEFNLTARRGETVRFYLSNTANVRNFNLHLPGAKLKLVGGDGGRVEREGFVDSILIAPSERVVLDVLFEQAGQFPLEHRTPDRTYRLGTVTVVDDPVAPTYAAEFYTLRQSPELAALRQEIAGDFDREPDKTIALIGKRPGLQTAPAAQHDHGRPPAPAMEWEDDMAPHAGMSGPDDMLWKIVDRATGRANHAIAWDFECGPRVKIRIENPVASDHPMQHPMHFHGQRFLVLRRDMQINDNLVWKDSVLVRAGEVVDILLDTGNPGTWMAHCHIAEHGEAGMRFNFLVKGEVGQEEAN